MSVLEELHELEQRVVARMAELRPLIEEYEQLRQVADRLGFDVAEATEQPSRRPTRAPGPKRTPSKRTTARRRGAKPSAGRAASRRSAGGTKAVGAQRRERVLAMIEQRPGITVPDISRELGVEPPPLYRVVRRLQADGLVEKEGKNLRLSNGRRS